MKAVWICCVLCVLMATGLVALWTDVQEKQDQIAALRAAAVPDDEAHSPSGTSAQQAPTRAAPDSRSEIVGGWSDPVRGIRGRLITSLDDLDRGGRFVSIYLELENVSDSAAPIEVSAAREVRVNVLKGDGSAVPSGGMTWSGIVHRATAVRLPPASRFRYRASGGGCGCPADDLIVCFPYARWIIKANDPTDYFVGGTMTVAGDKRGRRRSPWRGELRLPSTRVDVDEH